jgi:hypothetical protein
MGKQNVTLALSRYLLRKARILAVQQDTSLNALVERPMAEYVVQHAGYEQARRRQFAALSKRSKLGTAGKAAWSRDKFLQRQLWGVFGDAEALLQA